MTRHSHAIEDAAYDGAAAAAAKPVKPTTIFRGKRTRGYTPVSNAVINDDRLALDELGALLKLLSLPANWQMHPGQLRKVWGVGRDRYYRIVDALRAAGYVKRGEMLRGTEQNAGSFVAIEYLVYDEPQEPDTEAFDDEMADGASPPPAAGGEGVASLPHTGLPDTAEPHAADPHAEEKIDIINTPPTPPEPEPAAANADPPHDRADVPLPRTSPPVEPTGSGPPIEGGRGEDRAQTAMPAGADPPKVEDFLTPWRSWGGECVSHDRFARYWLRRSIDERRAAIAAIPDFVRDRQRRKWKLPDAATVMKDRLWIGLQAKASPKVFELTPAMPNWHRLRAWHVREGHGGTVHEMDRCAREKKPFPSVYEWPPPDKEGG